MEKLQRMKLSMADIQEATGETLHTLYGAINDGHLRTFLVGRRRFARPADVQAWIDHLQAESDAGRPVSYCSRERQKAGAK